MKIGNVGVRGRAFKLSKKARFEAAFEQIRRELHAPNISPVLTPRPGLGIRRKADRPTLTLRARR
jgi:hypothetical protein